MVLHCCYSDLPKHAYIGSRKTCWISTISTCWYSNGKIWFVPSPTNTQSMQEWNVWRSFIQWNHAALQRFVKCHFLHFLFIYYISLSIHPSLSIYQHECYYFFSFVWVNKECHYFLQVYSLLKQNFKIIHSKNKTNQPPGRHGSMLKMYQIRILEFGWGLFTTTMMATNVVRRKLP